MSLKTILTSLIWVAGEKIGVLLFAFFVNAYVARELGPVSYGAYSIALVLFAVLVQISDFGFRNIFIAKFVSDRSYLSSYFSVRLAGIFLSLVVLAGIYFILDDSRIDVIWIFFFILPFYFADIYEARSCSDLEMKKAAFTRLIVSLLMNSGRLFLILRGIELSIVFLTFLFDPLVKFLILKGKEKINFIGWRKLRIELLSAAPLLVSMIFLQLYLKFGYFSAFFFLEEQDYGLFSSALRLLDPVFMLGGMVVLVLNPYLSRAKEFDRYYIIYMGIIILGAMLLMLFVMLFSTNLVAMVYGDEYHDSMVYYHSLALLIPPMYLGAVSGFWYVKNGYYTMAMYRSILACLMLMMLLVVSNYFDWRVDGEMIIYYWLCSAICYSLLFDAIFSRSRPLFYMKIKSFFFLYFIVKR